MARCPAGHESQANDYCDTCGLVIGGESANASSVAQAGAGAVSGPAAGPGGAASTVVAGGVGAAGSGCPVCAAERNGRFCEECGYDFDLAEAMPEASMIPGVPPATNGQYSASPSVSAGPAGSQPEGQGSAAGGQGLDMEAELARAEAAAAASNAAVAASEAAAQTQATLEAQHVVGSGEGTSAAAAARPESGFEASTGLETVLPVSAPSEAVSGASEISLLINVDRDYYKAQIERGDIIESEFPFPKYPSERRFTFADGPVRIGRASASRGLNPEIDLTGPPLDPAVSHLHAQLLRHAEGWVVVDLGSSNGTRLNDAEEPLEPETEIPLQTGDRIHLGVWTTITLQ